MEAIMRKLNVEMFLVDGKFINFLLKFYRYLFCFDQNYQQMKINCYDKNKKCLYNYANSNCINLCFGVCSNGRDQ